MTEIDEVDNISFIALKLAHDPSGVWKMEQITFLDKELDNILGKSSTDLKKNFGETLNVARDGNAYYRGNGHHFEVYVIKNDTVVSANYWIGELPEGEGDGIGKMENELRNRGYVHWEIGKDSWWSNKIYDVRILRGHAEEKYNLYLLVTLAKPTDQIS